MFGNQVSVYSDWQKLDAVFAAWTWDVKVRAVYKFFRNRLTSS